jgi:hypothetical protein
VKRRIDDSHAEMLRRLRLGDLRKLFRGRYGATLPDDDAGREDLRELLLPISVGANANIKMTNAIEVWAPWMQPIEATQLIDTINQTPIQQRKPTTRQLGKRQHVTNKQREGLKLWTIAACDMNSGQMAEWRKAKARARMRKLRQSRGTKPQAASRSRTKPWEKQGISRAQWYRRSKAPTNGGGGADLKEGCNDDIEGGCAIRPVAQLQAGGIRKTGVVAVKPVPRRRHSAGN